MRYEVRVEGHLAAPRLRHFEGLAVREGGDGMTIIVGEFRDSSALYGLLSWLQRLGVRLVQVQRRDE